jgi:TolB-like protein/Flp pilus assembly protein TadD
VFAGKGLENLTELSLDISETVSRLQPKLVAITLLSDILLRDGGLQTRKWLSDQLTKLRSRGITVLATLNLNMHTQAEATAIADLFDGNLEIIENELNNHLTKFLRVRWMHGIAASETEPIPLDLVQPSDIASKSFVPSSKPTLDRRRLAVLPLENLSPDPNEEYFADGLTEELISTISNVSGLSVISRTSVKQYKKTSKKLLDIGQDLGAGTILEGSVRKAGNKIRVAIQLIEVKEDKHLWAQNYYRELEDVFAIQSDIAERVAKALEVKVLGEERRRLDERGSKNTEAFTLYMKGRSAYHEGTERGVRRAVEYFDRAVQQDAEFAPAYVGLADCYYFLGGTYTRVAEGLAKAKENLDKALALNPDLGEAHAFLGHWLGNELKWEEAEAEFRKALELTPSYADAHRRYAGLLLSRGRLDDALREAKKAQELDPLSILCMNRVAQVLHYRREYDQAIEQCKRVLLMEPRQLTALIGITLSYACKSMSKEAEVWFSKSKEVIERSPESRGYLPALLAAVGRLQEARALMKEVEQDPQTSPVAIAYYHTWVGDTDLAFEFLEKGYEARDRLLFDIKVDPAYDRLRPDPGYAVLLQKLHLA